MIPVRVMLLGDSAPSAALSAVIDTLQTGDQFCIDRVDPAAVAYADDYDAIIVQPATLAAAPVEAIRRFVERGGGLVLFGSGRWADQPGMADLIGRIHAYPERTEVIARALPAAGRLDPQIVVNDRVSLLDGPAGDVWYRLPWRGTNYPIVSEYAVGAGRVVTIGFDGNDGTLANPAVQRLVFQAIRAVTGQRIDRTIGVAMIGYGAIGVLHGQAVTATPGLDYRLVCDVSVARRQAAETAFPGVRTVEAIDAVANDPSVDLVIVSTPPQTHASVAIRLLQSGKHVVVEKPFAITVAEADRMIETAERHSRLLSVYQNRRWDADYQAIRELVQAGAVGDVFHVETFVGGFAHPCENWHSDAAISGGLFYDWGSHYLDWILNLLPGRVREVVASSHKRVWHDVTNDDQARITIRFDNGTEADFIHSDIAAALKPKWYLLGTRGAIVAEWRHETVTRRAATGDLIEERLHAPESPSRVLLHSRADDGRIHVQQVSLPVPADFAFHRNLATHLIDGEALAVTPAQARRNIAIMEAATRSAAQGAVPVAIDD